jgi:secondary thiamine-phosphate synthase enzyme
VKHSGSAAESAINLVTMQPIQLRDNPEMYRQTIQTLEFDTRGRGLRDITGRIATTAAETGIADGLVTLFLRHTSASLLIQENADPDVLGDLERFMARLVPDGDPLYRHRDEGPDDMPAHVRATLTAVQLSIPMRDGRLMLGTWQAIYLWEQRTQPHRRQIVVHVAGDGGEPVC